MSTEYTIREYSTGWAIGEITLTSEQFARYEQAAQQPEGIMPICDLPGKIDNLSDTVPPSTTIYLD